MKTSLQSSEYGISSDESHERKANGRFLALVGVVLFSAPLIGLLITVFGMVVDFNAVSTSRSGDSGGIFNYIQLGWNVTFVGYSVGFLGAILISMALFFKKNREWWFYQNVTSMAWFWAFTFFPVGIPMLILFMKRKREFS